MRRGSSDIGDYTSAEVFDSLRSDYRAAKEGRLMPRLVGVHPMGSTADYHVRSDLDYLRIVERSRMMDRNDPIVGQGIDRKTANVVQNGFALDPQTGDRGADSLLWQLWDNWCNDPGSCDVAGRMTIHRMAAMAYRAREIDGDCFALPVKGGRVQMIEAHQLRKPNRTKQNIVLGVELDNLRRPVSYYIVNGDIDPYKANILTKDVTRYPAYDAQGNPLVFHIVSPKRFTQTRGIGFIAPVVHMLGMHDDLQFANLVRAQACASFAFIEQMDPSSAFTSKLKGLGTTETETLADGTERTISGFSPGMRVKAPPGMTIQGFSPNVPNPEFFEHVNIVLKIVAANIHLPLAVLLLDPSQTNFSGYRGALDQARMQWRVDQQQMIAQFYRPIYKWKVRRWISEIRDLQRLENNPDVNLFAHRWNPPTWPYIEPSKDAAADKMRIDSGLTSPRRIAQERGMDHEELAVEMVNDRAYLIEQAIERASRFAPDTGVTWRDLMPKDLMPGASVPSSQKEPDDDDAARQLERNANG